MKKIFSKCKPRKCNPKPNHNIFVGFMAVVVILVSFTSIAALLTIGLGYPKLLSTNASGTAIFTQNDWSGGAAPGVITTQLTGWNKYDSAYALNTSTAGKISLGTSNWLVNGTPASIVAGSSQTEPVIVSDGEGGAIMAWRQDSDIYAQRIDSDGSIHSGWDPNGIPVTATGTGVRLNLDIVSDGQGGAFITWEYYTPGLNDNKVYIQRISGNGNTWNNIGMEVSSLIGQTSPKIISDGSGGAIVVWNDGRSDGDIYAQRFDDNARIHAGWNPDGMPVSTAVSNQGSPTIISDGSGGAIITWEDYRSGNSDIYTQRINSNGAVVWSDPNGTAIAVVQNNQSNPKIVSDGSSGAIIVWKDQRTGNHTYGQRIDGNGVIQWTPNGNKLMDYMGDTNITTDGSGGVYIAMSSNFGSGYDIHAQRVDSNGSIHTGWESWDNSGIVVCSASMTQSNPKIISDGSGGAIITWQDERGYFSSPMTESDIYAQRINGDGSVYIGWVNNEFYEGNPISIALGYQSNSAITSNGSDGAIIVWQDYRSNTDNDIYTQEIMGNGVIASYSGSLTSSIIDTGDQTTWSSLDWTANTPVDTYVDFQTRTSVADPVTNMLTQPGINLSASSTEPNPWGALSNINDGDRYSTRWQSEDNGSSISPSNPQWVAVDFGSPTKVSRLDMYYDPKMYPVDFDIQTCINNSSCDPTIDSDWNTVQSIVGNNSNDKFTTSFTTTETSKVRLFITKQIDEGAVNTVAIDELEIYSGAWSSWSPSLTTSGSTISSPVGQYIQYKANLYSNTGISNTPELTGVSVLSTPSDPNYAEFITPDFNCGPTPGGCDTVSTLSNALSVDTTTDLKSLMDDNGYSKLIIQKTAPAGNFQVLENVTPFASYSVSLDKNTSRIDLGFDLNITLRFDPSLVTDINNLKVCQDVDHDGLFSCGDPLSPDRLFDTSSPYLTGYGPDYISFMVSSLSNFLAGTQAKAAIYATGNLHVVYGGAITGFAGTRDGKEKKSAKTPLVPGPVGDSRNEAINSITTKVFTQSALMTTLGSKDFDKKIKSQCASIYDSQTSISETNITKNPQMITLPEVTNYITATRVVISDPVDNSIHTTTVCRKITSDKFNYDFNKDGVKDSVALLKNKVIKTVKNKCNPKDLTKICVQVDPGDEQDITVPANLNLSYPENVIWSVGVNSKLYEFILTSNTNWTAKACAAMPGGYKAIAAYDADGNPLVIKNNCVTGLLVNNGSTTITFEVQGLTTASTFDTKFTFEDKYGTNTTKIEKIIKNTRLK